MRSLAWMDSGLCLQVGADEWFPENGSSTKNAQKICAECPVQRECLEHALATDARYGVFGGVPERKRRGMAASRG
jgi:WhiB family redox-sensing transcriptional regulator